MGSTSSLGAGFGRPKGGGSVSALCRDLSNMTTEASALGGSCLRNLGVATPAASVKRSRKASFANLTIKIPPSLGGRAAAHPRRKRPRPHRPRIVSTLIQIQPPEDLIAKPRTRRYSERRAHKPSGWRLHRVPLRLWDNRHVARWVQSIAPGLVPAVIGAGIVGEQLVRAELAQDILALGRACALPKDGRAAADVRRLLKELRCLQAAEQESNNHLRPRSR